MAHSEEYEQGYRDGRIKSLEDAVKELAIDVKKLKMAMYMLYGAIALAQFLFPEIRHAISTFTR